MSEEIKLPMLLSDLAGSFKPALLEAGLSLDDLEAGLESLKYGAAKIGLEIGHAESLGIPIAEAVRDAEQFPAAHKLHNGIRNLLTLELPPELVGIAKSVMASPPAETTEALRAELARLACCLPHNQPERALARLLLFEAVRLNLLVLTWQDRTHLIRQGIEDETLDTLAEAEVEWLAQHPSIAEEGPEVRPLHVLVSSALVRLGARSEDAREAFANVSADVVMENKRRAKLDEVLSQMDSRDALLVRNYFAKALGEQRLSVERLMLLNPVAFDGSNRDALDQRRLRGVASLEEGNPRQRKKPAFIDLVLETQGENR